MIDTVKTNKSFKYNERSDQKAVPCKTPVNAISQYKTPSVSFSDSGLLHAQFNYNPVYLYRDDPNESVHRLYTLVGEYDGRNTRVSNEIISVVKELKEIEFYY